MNHSENVFKDGAKDDEDPGHLYPPGGGPSTTPTNINIMSVILAPAPHPSKSAVTNPVVDTMLVTVNAESRSAQSAESP